MAVATTARCVVCDRAFSPASKPNHVFTRAGGPAGLAHTSCAPGSQRSPYLVGYSETVPQIAAHLWIWSYHLRPSPERKSDAWWALSLACLETRDGDGLDGSLSPEQEVRLRWWTIDGPLQLGAHREPGIRAAYADLIREFRTWRAGLDDAPADAR